MAICCWPSNTEIKAVHELEAYEVAMKIGELAKKSGLAAHTIRFYEAEGLLKDVPRGDNGYRNYGEDELNTLVRIQLGQKLGLSLQELKVMCHHHEAWDTDKIIEQLHKKLDDIQSLRKTLDGQEKSIHLMIENLNSSEPVCHQTDELMSIFNQNMGN